MNQNSKQVHRMAAPNNYDPQTESAIAITGLAGRFPQARNVEEIWQNLRGVTPRYNR